MSWRILLLIVAAACFFFEALSLQGPRQLGAKWWAAGVGFAILAGAIPGSLG